MNKLLIIFIIQLVAFTVGQVWPSYGIYNYNPSYNSYPYQGLGYGGGCSNIVMSQLPCQQRTDQWNLYPDYQWQNYNMRPYFGISANAFVPYSSSDSVMPRNTWMDLMDLLQRNILLNKGEATTLNERALAPKLLIANILNDKDKFTVDGCSYDINSSRCVDDLNLCRGKCKNFGDRLVHDCRCVPNDLLAFLGLIENQK